MFGLNATLFWFIAGVIFFVLEALTPGFFLMFFGLGAWASAIVMLFMPFPAVFQWLIFMAVSVISLLMLRKRMKSLFEGRLAKNDNIEDSVFSSQYVGREVVVVKEIGPGRPGLVELNGTNWQARTESEAVFPAGDRVLVRSLEGLTLTVGK
ncbi:hypothetical protein C4J81_14485 [Deltaproteobacteria bacterium Smac51]|nr:hypothetical protein C4J81_14485 [Deltaproteobacteria bacterium Smac51]